MDTLLQAADDAESKHECAQALMQMHCAGIPWDTKVIAWDTETTGLTGVVVQLGVVGRSDTCVTFSYSTNVRIVPPFRMEKGAQSVHGLTEELLEQTGCDPSMAMARLSEIVSVAEARDIPFVAHNASFDKRAITRTAAAAQLPDPLVGSNIICTMQLGRRVTKSREGKSRPPKNVWLYEALCGPVPPLTALHDATEDAGLTAEAYIGGQRAGFW